MYQLLICVDFQDEGTPKQIKGPSGSGLQRTQSVHVLHCEEKTDAEDGLKRVASEPLLPSQETGVLLKRKFSFSEQDASVWEDGRKKHLRHEGKNTSMNNGTVILFYFISFFLYLRLNKI